LLSMRHGDRLTGVRRERLDKHEQWRYRY
jgi:hypothetical protein